MHVDSRRRVPGNDVVVDLELLGPHGPVEVREEEDSEVAVRDGHGSAAIGPDQVVADGCVIPVDPVVDQDPGQAVARDDVAEGRGAPPDVRTGERSVLAVDDDPVVRVAQVGRRGDVQPDDVPDDGGAVGVRVRNRDAVVAVAGDQEPGAQVDVAPPVQVDAVVVIPQSETTGDRRADEAVLHDHPVAFDLDPELRGTIDVEAPHGHVVRVEEEQRVIAGPACRGDHSHRENRVEPVCRTGCGASHRAAASAVQRIDGGLVLIDVEHRIELDLEGSAEPRAGEIERDRVTVGRQRIHRLTQGALTCVAGPSAGLSDAVDDVVGGMGDSREHKEQQPCARSK